MVYVSFIIPVLILILGIWMYKYPPKKINWLIGYRTFKSMKNKEMWDFAHKYCGKLWMLLGLIMIILTFLLYILVWLKVITFNESILLIIVFAQIGMLLLSVLIVENKLKIYKGE